MSKNTRQDYGWHVVIRNQHVAQIVKDEIGRRLKAIGGADRELHVTTLIAGKTTNISRRPIGIEGELKSRASYNHYDTAKNALVKAGKFADRAIALTLRERAIVRQMPKHDYTNTDPAPLWTHIFDDTVLRAARWAGLTTDELTRTATTNWYSVDLFDSGARVANLNKPETMTRIYAVMSGGRVIFRRAVISNGHNDIEINETGVALSLTIDRFEINEQLLQSIPGRQVNEVIGHPAFSDCHAVITSAVRIVAKRNKIKKIKLRVRPMPVLAEKPPHGENTSWIGLLAPGWKLQEM